MSTVPPVIVPAGFRLQEAPGGKFEIVRIDERLSETVAFRLTPSERVTLRPFIDSFASGSIGEALRWLVTHPEVRAVMASRVEASRTSP